MLGSVSKKRLNLRMIERVPGHKKRAHRRGRAVVVLLHLLLSWRAHGLYAGFLRVWGQSFRCSFALLTHTDPVMKWDL